MNYRTWNNILCEFFFSQKESMTFLSIDKESLESYAIERPEFIKQLEICKKENYSLENKKKYAWSDFLHIFPSHNSKVLFLNNFQTKIQESARNTQTPTIFPYLVLFIIPLSNDPELNSNAFYPKVNEFLRLQRLIGQNEEIKSIDMGALSSSLDFMWNNLSEWAAANDYIFNVNSRTSKGRSLYAAPFLSQLIFTASQRDNFKLLFYKAGLTPKQDVSKENILKILSHYHYLIGVSDKRWQLLNKNYKESVYSIFNQELDSWDGIALVQKKSGDLKQSQYLGVNQNLLLSLYPHHGFHHFSLYAKIPDASLGEDFFYESTIYGGYNFTIKTNGLADTSIWNDAICKSIINKQNIYFSRLGNKSIRLSYNPTDIEILEYSFGSYISCNKLQSGRKYMILISKSKTEFYNEWLQKNNAIKVTKHDLVDNYNLFYINNALVDLPASDLKRLHFDNKKTIEIVDTLILGKTEDLASLLYQGFPIYYQISGVDIINDHIHAVFNSEGKVEDMPLTYDVESNLWILPKITNIFLKQKQFQIFCNDIPVSPSRYKVIDFIPLNLEQYHELKFNSYGEYDENGEFEGLTIKCTNDINWSTIWQSMQKDGARIPCVLEKRKYKETDYLLYYLSTRSRYEKKDIIKAVDVLIQNGIFEIKNDNKWAIKTIIDNYFRLGYLNYDYIDGKHVLAVNKPTILLLPPKVKRKKIANSNVTEISITENYWTAILTGARTPKSIDDFLKLIEGYSFEGEKLYVRIEESRDNLMPQTIYLLTYSLDALEAFANKYGFMFQKCIYSNTLLNEIASVEDYFNHITSHESLERYDGINNYERVDYQYLATKGYYKKLNSFTPESAVVTYFPGTFREQTVLWKDGKQYTLDKHWGHLIGMKMENAKVIHFVKDNGLIQLPIMLQLPQLYARALTMVSGSIPIEIDGNRVYEICENPYTNAVNVNNILQKLSQK